MARHLPLGPSSADRWIACPGSLFGPPIPYEESDAAREGTTCHALLEFCLKFGDDPQNHLHSAAFDEKFPITQEMVDGVQLFLNTVNDLLVELGLSQEHVRSEEFLIHPAIPNEIFGGTTDCQIIGPNVLVTLDLKFGRKPIYGNSKQLTCYSLLALSKMDHTVDRIIQVVVQPRGNPDVSRHEPGVTEIVEVWEGISRTAQIYLDHLTTLQQGPPPGTLSAGSWCQYCRRKAGCPAIGEMMVKVAEENIFKHPDQETFISAGSQEIPTERLLWFEERADAIRAFLTDVKKALVIRAKNGEELPGRKLVVSWGHRCWEVEASSDDAVLRKIAKQLGLKPSDITTPKIFSPAQVEKLLKERGEMKEKKHIVDQLSKAPIVGVKLVDERARGEVVRANTAPEILALLDEEK